MKTAECQIGQRVMHETDNNGPIWRGEIIEIANNGDFVWVKWDGVTAQHLHDPSILEVEQ
jgi:hypothetical protein